MADHQTHIPTASHVQGATPHVHAAPVTHNQPIVSGLATTLGKEPNGPLSMERQHIAITNLMSPPEFPPYDSFQQVGNMMGVSVEKRMPNNVPISPPISPFKKPSNTIDPVPPMSPVVKDPILYPPTEPASPPAVPLFNDGASETSTSTSPSTSPSTSDARRVVDAHIAALPKSRFKKTTPPKREEYELTLAFKSNVMDQYLRNPQGWLNRERANLKADQAARLAARKRASKLAPILPASRPASHSSHQQVQAIRTHAHRVEKNRPATAKPRAPRAPRVPATHTIQVALGHEEQDAAPRRSIPANPGRAQSVRVSTTPERTARPSREDKDFNAVPDYCPPLSTLPNRSNCLKVDWKGTPLDLSTDPHRHLLHPEEVHLASSLRLDCATYLTNKRRLFEHRVRCAKMPKEFRKTDAQQACKIDVNKASKLWTAFDKVGWLDINHFRKFL